MVNAEFGWKLLLILSRARQQPATMKIQSEDKRTERKTRTVGWKTVFRKKAVGQLFKQSIFRAHQHPESKSCLVSSPIIAPYVARRAAAAEDFNGLPWWFGKILRWEINWKLLGNFSAHTLRRHPQNRQPRKKLKFFGGNFYSGSSPCLSWSRNIILKRHY